MSEGECGTREGMAEAGLPRSSGVWTPGELKEVPEYSGFLMEIGEQDAERLTDAYGSRPGCCRPQGRLRRRRCPRRSWPRRWRERGRRRVWSWSTPLLRSLLSRSTGPSRPTCHQL